MTYEYPTLIADHELKRLHYSSRALSEDLQELRKRCDLGEQPSAVVPFMEAVRLINEEAYRPCGNCLEEGGEVSNWKERAEAAEASLSSANERNERLREEVVRLSSPGEEEASDG